jgi:hypothetical protein
MAIATKRPRQGSADAPEKSAAEMDAAARRFVEGADKPEPVGPKERKKKERVVLHFDDDILERLDREAARRHISRGSLVRQLIAEHVPE